MEIIHDINQVPYQVARLKNAWESIKVQLERFEEHWPELCVKYFSQTASVERAMGCEWQLKGNVVGKSFNIRATPLAIGEAESPKFYAELVITVPGSDGEVVLSRMLMDRNCDIFSTTGDKILGDHDGYASYKLFTSIINAVLYAPAA